jgi:exonuclease SbcC
MIPIHLSLTGFLSYRDPVDLDFTKFDLACISGPNGAGKSSLLDAITFALFGQARTRDDALINSHAHAAEVSFTFEYEGNTYRVLRHTPRDKSTALEFHIQTGENKWKALTEHSLRETEAKIRETLRLDYETFVNASFFLQGKADQFTQNRPADRKRILSSVLGLEIWERYRQGAAERRKVIETEIDMLDGRLKEISAELDEEEDRKARLKDLETRLASITETRKAQQTAVEEFRRRAATVEQQAALVANLAAQLQGTQSQLTESRKRLEERRAEQAGFNQLIGREKEIENQYSALQKFREELQNWDKIASQFNEHERRRAEPLSAIQAEKARLETSLNTLRSQQARQEKELEAKKPLSQEHKAVTTEIKALEKRLADRSVIEGKLNKARKDHADAVGENPLLKQQMLEIRERMDILQAATGPICPTCGQTLTEEHRTQTLVALEKEGKQRGDRYRDNLKGQEQLADQVKKFEAAQADLTQFEEQLRLKSVREAELSTGLEELERLEVLWMKEGLPQLQQIEQSLKTTGYATEARAQLAALDAELKSIGYDAAKHDEVRAQEESARPIEAEMRYLEQARAAAKPIDREIKELVKGISDKERDLSQQEEVHKQAAENLDSVQKDLPDVTAAERHLLDLQEQENRIRQELGAAQQLVAVLESQRVRKKELETDKELLSGRVSHFQALERAFGKDGVPALLIEQALPQIENKANLILERLSTGPMHVSFLTQQEFKDKKRQDRRETLEIQISDSAGRRDYEMFSGGEAFRINFAIRLALSEVLAQRAGARLQMLVIDEGFGTQDEAGRMRLVEAINEIRPDFAKILVITHVEELKHAFPTRIEVEKGPRGSTLTIIH